MDVQRIGIKKLFAIGGLTVFFVLIFRLYFQHVGSFGCFDDCFNYIGGYFILKDRQLYSQIFFNHQPFTPYMSAFIQWLSKPKTMHQLIFAHRLATFLLAFTASCILMLRFGLKTLIFSLLFELTKYYFFGDRFLAEGIIVYPAVYLLGLVLLRLLNKKIYPIEYIIASILTWFIIFMREPYIPLAIFSYIFLITRMRINIVQLISVIVLIFLTCITFFSFPTNEYLFNIYTVNKTVELYPFQFSFLSLARIFGYPLYILFVGKENLVRMILVCISISFLLSWVSLLINRKYSIVFIGVFLLGLANLRYTLPGTTFYEAFHMVIWFALFIFLSAFLAFSLFQIERFRSVAIISLGFLLLPVVLMILTKSSFINEKVNKDYEFTTNYGNDFANGEVIKILSRPGNTLFLDGGDDLIYWQAELVSSYQYSWYTSVMPYFSKYRNAREKMFATTPPDFYYGNCARAPFSKNDLPKNLKDQYVNVLFSGKPSCIFVKESVYAKVTQQQKNKIKDLSFSIR